MTVNQRPITKVANTRKDDCELQIGELIGEMNGPEISGEGDLGLVSGEVCDY